MKTLFVLSFLLLSKLSFADAWDNLTLDQANKVVAELKVNPYVFDYCDCCDSDGEYAASVYLVKVVSTEIIQCSWNEEYYSVVPSYELIAQLDYTENGPNVTSLLASDVSRVSENIYMNYTWGFNKKTKMATPLFNIVSYDMYGDEPQSCKPEFSYPTPQAVKKVYKGKDYAKWYKSWH